MALMSKPSLLILDEPTTALDVTVEAAVVELVKDLGKKYGTSMLFISHNLGLVLETCDRLCVMYSGETVETGKISDVFDEMQHPYTQALFRSIPLPGADKNARPLVAIPGNFPLPHERPQGCNFGPRCDYFEPGLCDQGQIDMYPVLSGDRHETRCLKFQEIDWNAPISAGAQTEKPAPGDVVLRMDNLKKYYEVAANALFGGGNKNESGCGKSTFAKVLMGLETATDGQILLNNAEIQDTPIEDRDTKTISNVQMVFQNPFDTLNPSMTVGRQIIRALEIFGIGDSEKAREQRMLELLDLVKLPREFATGMPRQLSGGQTTLLFISHDLSIVRYLSDRVMVMYLGHVVEMGSTDQVFQPPYHPYTEALLSAVPIADTSIEKQHIVLEGDIPSAMNPPSGCPFQTRCRWKDQVSGGLCDKEVPPVRQLAEGHQVKCHLSDEILSRMEPVIKIAAE